MVGQRKDTEIQHEDTSEPQCQIKSRSGGCTSVRVRTCLTGSFEAVLLGIVQEDAGIKGGKVENKAKTKARS